jgi:hypothetical protein
MPLVDRIVATVFLGLLAGVLLVRATRAWADYRRQKRAVDLLVRSMTELEEPRKERRP